MGWTSCVIAVQCFSAIHYTYYRLESVLGLSRSRWVHPNGSKASQIRVEARGAEPRSVGEALPLKGGAGHHPSSHRVLQEALLFGYSNTRMRGAGLHVCTVISELFL